MTDEEKDERIRDLEAALRRLLDAEVGCGCCSSNGLTEYYEACSQAEGLL